MGWGRAEKVLGYRLPLAPGHSSFVRSFTAPRILSLEPMHMSLLGNASLTIKGNNLGSSYHVPYVTVGGMPCLKVIPVSSEEVVCKTPPGSAGNHPVGVSVSGRTTEACLCSDRCNDRVKRCVTYHRACGRGEIYHDPPRLTLQPSDTLPPLSSRVIIYPYRATTVQVPKCTAFGRGMAPSWAARSCLSRACTSDRSPPNCISKSAISSAGRQPGCLRRLCAASPQ